MRFQNHAATFQNELIRLAVIPHEAETDRFSFNRVGNAPRVDGGHSVKHAGCCPLGSTNQSCLLEEIPVFEVHNRPPCVNSICACSPCGIRVDLEAGNRNLPLLQEVLTKILKTCEGLRRFY